MASCKPDFSEQGTSRHNLEQSLLNCLQDFLQELEDNGKTHELNIQFLKPSPVIPFFMKIHFLPVESEGQ